MEKPTDKIAVIGAGVAGLSASFDLARAGHEVTVFEASDRPGGLASGFKSEDWKWSLEKYYHHWFQSDEHLLRLADDLGVRDRVIFPKPVTVLYHEGSFYPFDSPMAVLKFPGVPFHDRVRFGGVGAYLKFSRNWKSFEKYSAHEWLKKMLGERAYKVLWEPMLEGKFGPEHYKKVNMAWFWARIHARTPRLGTFEGGFQAFMNELAAGVQKAGARIMYETPVEKISTNSEGKLFLRTADGDEVIFDKILSTTSPGLMDRMTPELPEDYLEGVRNLKSLGAVVLVLALKKQLGPGYYWYNLPKSAGFPFLCLVEHTQFVSREHFGGDHIVYCGDYLSTGHPHFAMSKEELLEKFLPSLSKINPDFSPDWVRASWLFKDAYAQPVPFLNHSQNIPDINTPIPGLYWASMSHVYPWDRGTNFAVEIGRKTAARMLNSP